MRDVVDGSKRMNEREEESARGSREMAIDKRRIDCRCMVMFNHDHWSTYQEHQIASYMHDMKDT